MEAEEVERFPQEETAELAGLYQEHGLPADGARALAESVMANPRTALGVMAQGRRLLGRVVLPGGHRPDRSVRRHERHARAGRQRGRLCAGAVRARRARHPSDRSLCFAPGCARCSSGSAPPRSPARPSDPLGLRAVSGGARRGDDRIEPVFSSGPSEVLSLGRQRAPERTSQDCTGCESAAVGRGLSFHFTRVALSESLDRIDPWQSASTAA